MLSGEVRTCMLINHEFDEFNTIHRKLVGTLGKAFRNI